VISELLRGARYLLTGISLLGRPGVGRYVIIPLLISAIIFTGGIWLTGHVVGQLIDSMLPQWLNWLRYLLWPLLGIVALAIIYVAFTLVANLIGAPFNGLLAEAVEASISGGTASVRVAWKDMPGEIASIILSELRKMVHFALWAIPFLLLLFVPLIGPVLWFLFGAWVFVCNYADYPMGNHGLKFVEQRRMLGTRRAMSLGFGIAALLITLVPVLNFVAMPAAVAGVTAMYLAELRGPASASAS
jgi:CysZ protein